MKSVSALLVTLVLAALLAGCGGGGSTPAGNTLQVAPSTTATPKGNVYGSAQSVSLQADRAASIYYTLDGTTPSAASPKYSGPIAIGASATLKFLAIDTLGNSESVKTQSYQIVQGPLLRLTVKGISQPMSGVGVTLTLPAGVTAPTAQDGSLEPGAVLPSGGTFLNASIMTIPGSLGYDPVTGIVTFYLVSSAPGGFGAGEFAALGLRLAGAMPDKGAFSATLSPVDLLGNVVSGAALSAELNPEP